MSNEPRKIPPFYISRTLMGYGGGRDLNRVTMTMPGERDFVIYEMGEPRSDDELKKWHRLINELNKLWEKSP